MWGHQDVGYISNIREFIDLPKFLMLSLELIFLNTYSCGNSIKIQLKEESFHLHFDTNFIPLDPNMYDLSFRWRSTAQYD